MRLQKAKGTIVLSLLILSFFISLIKPDIFYIPSVKAATLSPTTVASYNKASFSTTYDTSFQNNAFTYNGYDWYFYWNGSHISYTSILQSSGENSGIQTYLTDRINVNYAWSISLDKWNNTFRLVYTNSTDATPMYCAVGNPSGANITWNSRVEIAPTQKASYYSSVFAWTDGLGYCYAVWRNYDAVSNCTPYVTKVRSNDTVVVSGYPKQVSSTSNSYWFLDGCSYANGNSMIFAINGITAQIQGCNLTTADTLDALATIGITPNDRRQRHVVAVNNQIWVATVTSDSHAKAVWRDYGTTGQWSSVSEIGIGGNVSTTSGIFLSTINESKLIAMWTNTTNHLFTAEYVNNVWKPESNTGIDLVDDSTDKLNSTYVLSGSQGTNTSRVLLTWFSSLVTPTKLKTVVYPMPNALRIFHGLDTPNAIFSGDTYALNTSWICHDGSLDTLTVEHNNTGSYVNSTYAFSKTLPQEWRNFTLTLNATGECWINITLFCNTTTGYWGYSAWSIYVFMDIPSPSKKDFGNTVIPSSAIYYNGSKGGGAEYIITTFFNTSYTPLWKTQVRGFNINSMAWTPSYTVETNTFDEENDGHYAPAISTLWDGRLIVMCRGYAGLFYPYYSTYSLNSSMAIDTILNTWIKGYRIEPSYYPSNGTLESTSFAYPNPATFEDNLVVFERNNDGMGVTSMPYFVMCNGTYRNASTYVAGAELAISNEWHHVGDSPYLQNNSASSYIYIDGWGHVSSWDSYYQIVVPLGMNVTPITNMYLVINTTTNGTPYTEADTFKITSSSDEFDVWGTWNNELYGERAHIIDVSSHTDTFWKYGLNFGIKAPDKAIQTGAFYNITSVSVIVTYRGWGTWQGLAYPYHLQSDEDAYLTDAVKVNGSSIFVSCNYYDQISGISQENNTHSIYSPDKGHTWKAVNGTTVTLPVNLTQLKIADIPDRVRVGTLLVDEYGYAVSPYVWINGSNIWAWYNQLGFYESTAPLGTSTIAWTQYTPIDVNGSRPYNTGSLTSTFFIDPYYKRLAFWAQNNITGYCSKYVRYPSSMNLFIEVYSDLAAQDWSTTYYALVRDIPPEMTLSCYEIFTLDYMFAMGNLTLGASTSTATSTYAYGSKFTAARTANVTSVFLYADMPDATIWWTVGLYSASFNRLIYSTSAKLVTGHGGTGWGQRASINYPVVSGTSYWVVWTLDTALPIDYHYTATASGSNNTFITTDKDWGVTIDPQTYYDINITILVTSDNIYLRGLGVDEYSMVFVLTGTNTTIAGQPCEFHTYVSDGSGLAMGNLRTNNTGAWVNNSYTSLSGFEMWILFTETLNSSKVVVAWEIWANDSFNNWGSTGIQYITLGISVEVTVNETLTVSTYMQILKGTAISYTSIIGSSSTTSYSSERARNLAEALSLIDYLSKARETQNVYNASSSLLNSITISKEKAYTGLTTLTMTSTLPIAKDHTVALSNTMYVLPLLVPKKETGMLYASTIQLSQTSTMWKERLTISPNVFYLSFDTSLARERTIPIATVMYILGDIAVGSEHALLNVELTRTELLELDALMTVAKQKGLAYPNQASILQSYSLAKERGIMLSTVLQLLSNLARSKEDTVTNVNMVSFQMVTSALKEKLAVKTNLLNLAEVRTSSKERGIALANILYLLSDMTKLSETEILNVELEVMELLQMQNLMNIYKEKAELTVETFHIAEVDTIQKEKDLLDAELVHTLYVLNLLKEKEKLYANLTSAGQVDNVAKEKANILSNLIWILENHLVSKETSIVSVEVITEELLHINAVLQFLKEKAYLNLASLLSSSWSAFAKEKGYTDDMIVQDEVWQQLAKEKGLDWVNTVLLNVEEVIQKELLYNILTIVYPEIIYFGGTLIVDMGITIDFALAISAFALLLTAAMIGLMFAHKHRQEDVEQ